MRKHLTAKAIEALKSAPSGKRYDVADAIVPGFGVRVNDKGRKSFTLTARFGGSPNPTRRTIAEVGAMELAVAREIARAWLVQIDAGIDPRVEMERKREEQSNRGETFRQVAARFLDQYVRRTGLRSGREIERLFEKYLYPVWGKREFETVRRGDVARLLDSIEERAPSQADHVLALVSKLCNWYMAREESYTTPIARGMRRTKASERARDRVLSDHELRLFWQATGEVTTYGAFLRTALLTAQRRTKVLEMCWQDIDDFGLWSIPSEAREKSNAQTLRLSRLALRIIDKQPRRDDSDLVFAGRGATPINGLSKMKRALDARIKELNDATIPDWTVHDLRRTARSLMSRAGVRPDICERVLGHAIPGVQGVYDRYSYEEEKADAITRLADLVTRIIENKAEPSNLIPLRVREADRQPDLQSTG